MTKRGMKPSSELEGVGAKISKPRESQVRGNRISKGNYNSLFLPKEKWTWIERLSGPDDHGDGPRSGYVQGRELRRLHLVPRGPPSDFSPPVALEQKKIQ